MAPVKISNTLRGTAPQHFGECGLVGSKDRKVSAGELRLQAGGDAPTRAGRGAETMCAEGGRKRHRVLQLQLQIAC